MTHQNNFPEAHLPDAAAMSQAFGHIAEHSGHILAEAVSNAGSGGSPASADPLNLAGVAMAAARTVMADPFRLINAQADLWFDCGKLCAIPRGVCSAKCRCLSYCLKKAIAASPAPIGRT